MKKRQYGNRRHDSSSSDEESVTEKRKRKHSNSCHHSQQRSHSVPSRREMPSSTSSRNVKPKYASQQEESSSSSSDEDETQSKYAIQRRRIKQTSSSSSGEEVVKSRAMKSKVSHAPQKADSSSTADEDDVVRTTKRCSDHDRMRKRMKEQRKRKHGKVESVIRQHSTDEEDTSDRELFEKRLNREQDKFSDHIDRLQMDGDRGLKNDRYDSYESYRASFAARRERTGRKSNSSQGSKRRIDGSKIDQNSDSELNFENLKARLVTDRLHDATNQSSKDGKTRTNRHRTNRHSDTDRHSNQISSESEVDPMELFHKLPDKSDTDSDHVPSKMDRKMVKVKQEPLSDDEVGHQRNQDTRSKRRKSGSKDQVLGDIRVKQESDTSEDESRHGRSHRSERDIRIKKEIDHKHSRHSNHSRGASPDVLRKKIKRETNGHSDIKHESDIDSRNSSSRGKVKSEDGFHRDRRRDIKDEPSDSRDRHGSRGQRHDSHTREWDRGKSSKDRDRREMRPDEQERMNRQFQDDQRPRNSRNDEQFPSNSRTHDNSGHDRRNSDQPKKEEPNFGLSGKLTEYTNTYKGVVIKYNEPVEARKPKTRWRLYPFKGQEALNMLPIHRQSAFLLGRDRKIADIPVDHPSCSKQHAVLQFRLVNYERDDGMQGRRVRPYIIDLETTNGTFVNNKKIEPRVYVELMEKDVVKFGFSSRDYVLLHEKSKGDLSSSEDDGDDSGDEEDEQKNKMKNKKKK